MSARRRRRALSSALLALATGVVAAAVAEQDLGVRPGHIEAAARAAELYDPPRVDGPVRILLLGDSITQGGREPGQGLVEGYRYALFEGLVDRGARFDFVGSMDAGLNEALSGPTRRGLAFDRDHEGHWGFTTRRVRRRLGEWLARYDVDVALVLLGTNDADHAMTVEDTVDELRKIVALLRADNPRVVVLLGQVFHEGLRYRWLRWRTAALAERASTRASPVIAVDHAHRWVGPPGARGTLTLDGVHPNRAGDARLARNWLAALAPFLARFEGSRGRCEGRASHDRGER